MLLLKRSKINGGLCSYLQDMFDAVFALTLRRSIVTLLTSSLIIYGNKKVVKEKFLVRLLT
jgi:hypothetical protein